MIKVNLKKILHEKNMTMTQLHQITGMPLNTLSLFATHKTKGVQYSTLEKIISVLDVTVGELIEVVDDVFEVSVKNNIENNYSQLYHSGATEKHAFSFEVVLKNIKNKNIQGSIKNDVQIKFDRANNTLYFNINRVENCDPTIINENITNAFDYRYNGFPEFYYILSYLILDEFSKDKNFSKMNISWRIVVDWEKSKAFPFYYYNEKESDSLHNNNDCLVFLPQICEVHLVPKDIKSQKAYFDFDIPYVINLDHLDRLKTVHLVEIDPITLERKVYLSGKSCLV